MFGFITKYATSSAEVDKTKLNNFRDDVRRSLVRSVISDESFLPENKIEKLVTRDKIKLLLPYAKPDLVSFVCDHARKLFLTASLRRCDLQVVLNAFRAYDMTDNSLPIRDLSSEDEYCTVHTQGSQKICSHERALEAFHDWTTHDVWNFYKDQWTFCAPVLDFSCPTQELDAKCILPFTHKEDAQRDGHFSMVFQADIHPSHQRGCEPSKKGIRTRVALKELKSLSEPGYNVNDSWRNEANALFQICELRHKHLISQATAFRHGQKRFIMLEWADGGTLRDVWQREPQNNILDSDKVMSVLEQLTGLASALSKLHGTNTKTKTAMATSKDHRKKSTDPRSKTIFSPGQDDRNNNLLTVPRIRFEGISSDEENYSSDNMEDSQEQHWRHGDLKPDNILQFKDPTSPWLGTLKIADLGLAKQHAFATNRRQEQTSQKYATSHYEAPEVITNRNLGLPRSRRYDIWSMGCIIFEFTIWLLYGYEEGLRKFYKEGKGIKEHQETLYFTADSTFMTARVSVAAQAWISHILEFDPECKRATPSVIKDLIVLVRDRLLVVDLPTERMSQEDIKRCRASADDLERSLTSIKRKAMDDEHRGGNYLCSGESRAGVFPPHPQQARRSSFLSTSSGSASKPSNLNFSNSELNPPYSNDIHLGLPKLFNIASSLFYDLLISWLKDCDLNHPQCRPTNSSDLRVPTRLIGVSPDDTGNLKVYLRETTNDMCHAKNDLRYIALSHPWGSENEYNHFCTTRENLASRLSAGIDINEFPNTFRHAIEVTQKLGVPYLWIDSLCIVQGPGGDFDTEAKRMESVFSSAYCVIAASRANGTSSGFLWERPEREMVKLDQYSPNESVYVCEAIDNFQYDVIEGALNKRGWVLQERALAPRTIYFTEKQTYWECGQGVRCETLTKLTNSQAAFLGDSNFPKLAMRSSRGAKIRFYESLYKQYSSLDFTKLHDRPIAIAGLEQRLVSAFKTEGGYGVFNGGFFGRSLLWMRDTNQSAGLTMIEFPRDQKFRVPTWSWMAYDGPITYLNIPFDNVRWVYETAEGRIQSPWVTQDASSTSISLHTGELNGRIDLTVQARELKVPLAETQGRVIYDEGILPQTMDVRCVIVGIERSKAEVAEMEDLENYVLLATPLTDPSDGFYRRVGVGRVPGSWIESGKPGLRVHVS
ncbi:serine/threonine protein kinase [Fusarium austroafricanum]|uniref:Serine/threonine protein kinase n=1 Tax=Fusarium austroafricanum TaxID=2364996 RepID=A0A8H4JS30_9HYPO|nr:serine/threonine protein kinase [Fusarium austroafricanum]